MEWMQYKLAYTRWWDGIEYRRLLWVSLFTPFLLHVTTHKAYPVAVEHCHRVDEVYIRIVGNYFISASH